MAIPYQELLKQATKRRGNDELTEEEKKKRKYDLDTIKRRLARAQNGQ